jgi:hypothetical protein
MNRFKIIWNLGFCQIHILGLPLLQKQNNFSKLFIINPYALSQTIFFWKTHEVYYSIPYFYPYYYTNTNAIICNY